MIRILNEKLDVKWNEGSLKRRERLLLFDPLQEEITELLQECLVETPEKWRIGAAKVQEAQFIIDSPFRFRMKRLNIDGPCDSCPRLPLLSYPQRFLHKGHPHRVDFMPTRDSHHASNERL